MRFGKGHGTENDFVIIPDPDGLLDLPAGLVAAMCDRRAGIGADGVLRVVRGKVVGEDADWFMDYRNADGSTAEMCGNGIRVFVRYLIENGLAEPGEHAVATRAGPRTVWAGPAGDVTVDMGPVRALGVERATVGGRVLEGLHVTTGNPHLACVVADPVEDFDLSRAPVVDDAVFRDGVNVEIIRLAGERRAEMRVHERGSAETRSCGTGAVASAAAAAHATGSVGGDWEISVPGGRLEVSLDGETARLTGPAVIVAEGELLQNNLLF